MQSEQPYGWLSGRASVRASICIKSAAAATAATAGVFADAMVRDLGLCGTDGAAETAGRNALNGVRGCCVLIGV